MKRKVYCGGWLPQNRKKAAAWVNRKLVEASRIRREAANGAEENAPADWPRFKHYEVTEFRDLVMNKPELRLLGEQMIEQGYAYDEDDPTGKPQIRDLETMFVLIDYIMGTAPEYMQPDEEGRGLIGFPINAVLDWCMGTQAGYAFFLNEEVNLCLQKILERWCDFLNSPDSVYVLNTSETGWLCDAAKKELELDSFECNTSAEHYGFRSWNAFFTRKFKPGMRPVEAPDDPYIITNACESAPYRISMNVQRDTKFWLKGQPYSLEYMLDHHEYVARFTGGIVYQAFLSATHYHCWHAPVDGTVVDVRKIPGTYYAEVNSYPYDDAGPNESQGYITHVAARALIMIEADNRDIGMVCFMPVGMSEVSSCNVAVQKGAHVKKGDYLGCFLFGGSTHCLIFEKDVIDSFVADAIPAEDFNDSTLMKLNTKLATVKRRTNA